MLHRFLQINVTTYDAFTHNKCRQISQFHLFDYDLLHEVNEIAKRKYFGLAFHLDEELKAAELQFVQLLL